MSQYEKYNLLISTLYLITTLLLAGIAIWGERIRQFWLKPALNIDLDEPTLTSHTDNKKGWYYHLKVTNNKKASPAKNVRVLLCRVFKKAPDGSWYEHKFSGPVQVLWRWPEYVPQYATIGPDEHSTFGCLREDSKLVQLKLFIVPLNLTPNIKRNEPTRLEFKAVSDTAESKTLTIEVAWDGKWTTGSKEMSNHLIIKKVNV